MASVVDAAIIELAVGQRADSFTLELLATDRTPLGSTLQAHADSNPQVQVNTTRASIRTCSGVTVENPPMELDLDRTRVRPVLTLSNGSRFELGVLMFGTDTRRIFTAGQVWTPELFDENFLLDQDLDYTVSRPAGASALGLLEEIVSPVFSPLGIPTDWQVDDVTLASQVLYAVASSRLDAVKAVASLLGALPPFFSNAGYHTLKPAPQPGSAPNHSYGSGTRIFDGTATTSSSRYKAPNRYIVKGDDVGGAAVRGVYDLPPSAPNSYFQTGKIVTSSHTVSGVTDPDLAAQIAYVDALTDQTTYGTVAYSAAADPRHDCFETVDFLGDVFMETAWTMGLTSGAEHSHQGTRMYI